jgi:hypothetical protein
MDVSMDKQSFIEWLSSSGTNLIMREINRTDYDWHQFGNYLSMMKFMLQSVLHLSNLSVWLDEYYQLILDGDLDRFNKHMNKLHDNWEFYIDQVMDKLCEVVKECK